MTGTVETVWSQRGAAAGGADWKNWPINWENNGLQWAALLNHVSLAAPECGLLKQGIWVCCAPVFMSSSAFTSWKHDRLHWSKTETRVCVSYLLHRRYRRMWPDTNELRPSSVLSGTSWGGFCSGSFLVTSSSLKSQQWMVESCCCCLVVLAARPVGGCKWKVCSHRHGYIKIYEKIKHLMWVHLVALRDYIQKRIYRCIFLLIYICISNIWITFLPLYAKNLISFAF